MSQELYRYPSVDCWTYRIQTQALYSWFTFNASLLCQLRGSQVASFPLPKSCTCHCLLHDRAIRTGARFQLLCYLNLSCSSLVSTAALIVYMVHVTSKLVTWLITEKLQSQTCYTSLPNAICNIQRKILMIKSLESRWLKTKFIVLEWLCLP